MTIRSNRHHPLPLANSGSPRQSQGLCRFQLARANLVPTLLVTRMELRKWGKPATIVEGIDGKSVNLSDLATKLKTYCACGGTSKNNSIILQGDHRDKVKKVLVGYGFPEASIELH